MNPGWPVIRTYINEAQAEQARMLLEGSGFTVRISSDDCGGWTPYLETATGIKLAVPPDQENNARELLNDSETV